MTVKYTYIDQDYIPTPKTQELEIKGDLNKTQLKSLVRFLVSGMRSASVGTKGIKEIEVLVNDALEHGKSNMRGGDIVLEIASE